MTAVLIIVFHLKCWTFAGFDLTVMNISCDSFGFIYSLFALNALYVFICLWPTSWVTLHTQTNTNKEINIEWTYLHRADYSICMYEYTGCTHGKSCVLYFIKTSSIMDGSKWMFCRRPMTLCAAFNGWKRLFLLSLPPSYSQFPISVIMTLFVQSAGWNISLRSLSSFSNTKLGLVDKFSLIGVK